MTFKETQDFLNEKVLQYNNQDFIDTDPVQIPHLYTSKEDIEISAFLAATIAWGNRKMIIKNAKKMMDLMGNSPYDFVLNHNDSHIEKLDSFVHRTFNGQDFNCFIKNLKHIYTQHHGMEHLFAKHIAENRTAPAISNFKKVFFEADNLTRTHKHISDPEKGSAAKRINMFLRWMVRQDQKGVDLGIWKSIPTAALSCPLDVHSGNVARKLNLLTRKQNDGKALLELDNNLRKMDPIDPVKYDFALFGLGVFEGF